MSSSNSNKGKGPSKEEKGTSMFKDAPSLSPILANLPKLPTAPGRPVPHEPAAVPPQSPAPEPAPAPESTPAPAPEPTPAPSKESTDGEIELTEEVLDFIRRLESMSRGPKEYGAQGYEERMDRQAVYIDFNIAAELATLYVVLPGNKNSILNGWLKQLVEENRKVLEQPEVAKILKIYQAYFNKRKRKKGKI